VSAPFRNDRDLTELGSLVGLGARPRVIDPHPDAHGRWQLTRFGVVNSWNWTVEEFVCKNGCCALIGRNGSGKTLTTSTSCPTLFDGDISPKALSVDKIADTKLAGRHLGDRSRGPVTGSWWQEFARTDTTDEGEATRWLTIGLWLHKPAEDSSTLERAWFLFEGRIGLDLRLESERVPAGIEALAKQLDSIRGGRLFSSSADIRHAVEDHISVVEDEGQYSMAVRQLMFSPFSRDQFRALTGVLRTLRSIRIGDGKISANDFHNTLTSALPGLDSGPVKLLADVLARTGNLELQLENARSQQEALSAVAAAYRRYAGAQTAGVAARLLNDADLLDQAVEHKKGLERSVGDRQREMSAAEDAETAADEEARRLHTDVERLDGELTGHPGSDISLLRESAENAAKAADEAKGHAENSSARAAREAKRHTADSLIRRRAVGTLESVLISSAENAESIGAQAFHTEVSSLCASLRDEGPDVAPDFEAHLGDRLETRRAWANERAIHIDEVSDAVALTKSAREARERLEVQLSEFSDASHHARSTADTAGEAASDADGKARELLRAFAATAHHLPAPTQKMISGPDLDVDALLEWKSQALLSTLSKIDAEGAERYAGNVAEASANASDRLEAEQQRVRSAWKAAQSAAAPLATHRLPLEPAGLTVLTELADRCDEQHRPVNGAAAAAAAEHAAAQAEASVHDIRSLLRRAADLHAQAQRSATHAEQADQRARAEDARANAAIATARREATAAQEAARSDAEQATKTAGNRAEALTREAARAAQEAVDAARATADGEISEAEQSATDAAQTRALAAGQTETAAAQWLAAARVWAAGLKVLPRSRFTLPAKKTLPSFDHEALERAVAGARHEAEVHLARESTSTAAVLEGLEARRRLLREQIEQADRHDAGPLFPQWRPERSGRAGAPLWALIDFVSTLTGTARNRLEGALLAVGLLDAWVCEDGALIAGDSVLRAEPCPPGVKTLAAFLIPEPAGAVPAATVTAILHSIAVTKDAADSDLPIAVDTAGTARLGILHASAPEGWQARHIGATARERARRALLTKLRRQLDEVEREVTQAEEHIRAIEDKRASARQEAADLPPARDLLGLRQHLREADEAAARAAGIAEATRDRADAAYNAAWRNAEAGKAARTAEIALQRDTEIALHQQNLDTALTNISSMCTRATATAEAARDETVAAAEAARRGAATDSEAARGACRRVGLEPDTALLAAAIDECGLLTSAAARTASAIGAWASAGQALTRAAEDAAQAIKRHHDAVERAASAAHAAKLAREEASIFPQSALDEYRSVRRDADLAALEAGHADARTETKRLELSEAGRELADCERSLNEAAERTGHSVPTTGSGLSAYRCALRRFSELDSDLRAAAIQAATAVRDAIRSHSAAAAAADEMDAFARAAREKAAAARVARHRAEAAAASHGSDFEKLGERLDAAKLRLEQQQRLMREHGKAARDAEKELIRLEERLDVAQRDLGTRREAAAAAFTALSALFTLNLVDHVAGAEALSAPQDLDQARDCANALLHERFPNRHAALGTAAILAAQEYRKLTHEIARTRPLLADLGKSLEIEDVPETDWRVISVRTAGTSGHNTLGGSRPLHEALTALELEIGELQEDFTQELETNFKDVITQDLRKHITERIALAQQIVRDIAANLKDVRTGVARVGIRLTWHAREDETSRRALELINSPRLDGNYEEMFDFFSSLVRNDDGQTESLEQRIERVFDYRLWHTWKVEVSHTRFSGEDGAAEPFKTFNARSNPFEGLSGGERRLATMLPLLAALRAFYSTEGYTGPRTVIIDELQAAFDGPNLRLLLALLNEWDLDLIATLPESRPLLCAEAGHIGINRISVRGKQRVSSPSIWEGKGRARPVNVKIAGVGEK